MIPNIKSFQESITRELELTKDRVRNLIGNANWAEEGRFKEAILRKTISQFLPGNLVIGTGFIVANYDHHRGSQGIISHQVDIIVYDGSIPVVFKEGDFVIVTESAVRAIIEVKSATSTKSKSPKADSALNNIIKKFEKLKAFSSFNPLNEDYRQRFIGIFSYSHNSADLDDLQKVLENSAGIVNHISLGRNKFIKFWADRKGLFRSDEEDHYSIYNIADLSFSYFISNLLHSVSDQDPYDRYWFSFPIEGTKEVYRERRVKLKKIKITRIPYKSRPVAKNVK